MKYFSEETKHRMSVSAKKRAETTAFLDRVKGYWKPVCPEIVLKTLYEQYGMSQTEIAYTLGVTQKRVWKSMQRYGIKARPAIKRNQLGENNGSWKGDNAGYSGFHRRIKEQKGKPHKCEICGTTDVSKTYDWANMTGHYENPDDYKRLCRSCHWKHDLTYLNFKGATGGRSALKEVPDAK
jgi:hypothetical protein